MGLIQGRDATRLDDAGWGVIFSHNAKPGIRDALEELLAWRQQQAGDGFRVFEGRAGYRPGEPTHRFLARHGARPGPADPDKMPYYLLIVGSPEEVSFRFQRQLDVQYAVGRLHFDSLDEYASYAGSVVAAETGNVKLAREAALFSASNPDDPVTRRGTESFVRPLYDRLRSEHSDWRIDLFLDEQATKAQLGHLLGGEQAPALVLGSGHGMAFPRDSPLQERHQGAILCQDWPGPRQWQQPIPPDFYFAGDDVAENANLLGTLAFFLASYGAGTPLSNHAPGGSRAAFREIAEKPFVGALPNRLLSRPRGGALAVVGHADRSWGYCFEWKGARAQMVAFSRMLNRLLDGHPVGSAMEHLNQVYAELFADVYEELEEREHGKASAPFELSGMWTAMSDVGSFVVVGDPAVRLAVVQDGEVAVERPVLSIARKEIYFNGVSGATGEYGLPPMTSEELSALVQGEVLPEEVLSELRYLFQQQNEQHFGVRASVDPKKLDEAGWGVIFAHDADPAVKEALAPLLELRREQAGERFRRFEGAGGFRPGEAKSKFLARHGAGPGPVNPEKVPYYLLIVGGPKKIPYRFQSQLDVQHAVGRICFERVEEYASYAESVVAADSGRVTLPRLVSFFGVENDGDQATGFSSRNLVTPLHNYLQAKPDWQVSAFLKEEATKANLARLLGGEQMPALVFTASHGMEFPNGDPRQIPHQGALLCQDWPGPGAWQGAIPPDFYFAGDDLAADADLRGLIGFHLACYSAGTPHLDEFANQAFEERAAIAPHSFPAALPSKMLSHPRGGALAVVGHVERAWGYSFRSQGAGAQTMVFESALNRLLDGHPLGSAIEYFDMRYAELSTVLADQLEDIEFGAQADPHELAGIWSARNDARSFMIVGDPAVRLRPGDPTLAG